MFREESDRREGKDLGRREGKGVFSRYCYCINPSYPLFFSRAHKENKDPLDRLDQRDHKDTEAAKELREMMAYLDKTYVVCACVCVCV